MGSTLSTGVSSMLDACDRLSSGGAQRVPNGGGGSSSGGAGAAARHPGTVTINGVKYLVHKLIGEGGYAFVYSASDPDRNSVALKRFVIQDAEQQDAVLQEVEIHKSLCPHPNIVAYRDHEVLRRAGAPLPEVWVVMELCGESLEANINARLQGLQGGGGGAAAAAAALPTEAEIAVFLSDMVAALAHMHGQQPPVAHWDVKVSNFIFPSSRGTAGVTLKLCDFGSCSRQALNPRSGPEIARADCDLEQRMTLLYRPPESVDLWAKKAVDAKADIWALGVVLYVLLYGTMPFPDTKSAIETGKPQDPPAGLADRAPRLQQLLHEMLLVKDPAQRADIFAVSERLAALFPIHALKRIQRPDGWTGEMEPRFK